MPRTARPGGRPARIGGAGGAADGITLTGAILQAKESERFAIEFT